MGEAWGECAISAEGTAGTLARAASGKTGGRGGIRTLEPVSRLLVFKTSAIDHSATLPFSVPPAQKTLRSSLKQSSLKRRRADPYGIFTKFPMPKYLIS